MTVETSDAVCTCTTDTWHVGCPVAGHGWGASRRAWEGVEAERARLEARVSELERALGAFVNADAVVASAGITSGAYRRHVWPCVKVAKAVLEVAAPVEKEEANA